jgi:hypothetical protein
MELLSFLLMTQAATKGKKDKSVSLLQEMKEHLKEDLDNTEKFINAGILSGQIEGETAKGLNIALKQARLALDAEDYGGVIQACDRSLVPIGSSLEPLNEDLEQIQDFAELVRYAFGAGLQLETKIVTGMIQAA